MVEIKGSMDRAKCASCGKMVDGRVFEIRFSGTQVVKDTLAGVTITTCKECLGSLAYKAFTAVVVGMVIDVTNTLDQSVEPPVDTSAINLALQSLREGSEED